MVVVEFYRQIFSKPTYWWKTTEIIYVIALIGFFVSICALIWFIIKAIINHYKDKQYRSCVKNDCTRFIASCKRCKDYETKKRHKKEKTNGTNTKH